MRKFLLPAVLFGGLTAGWLLNRAPAAIGTADTAASLSSNLQMGDQIELYLDHSKAGSQVSLDGKLTALNESTFELIGENEVPLANGAYRHQQVLYIVPRDRVIYVEKTISSQSFPATQP